MAQLGRPLLRLGCLSSKSGSISVKRHLFSSEILGVENFKRIRIFEKDRLCNKTEFVEQLSTLCHGSQIQDRRVIADLVKLIYIADEKTDVSLATVLLKQLYASEAQSQACSSSVATQSQKLTTEGPLSPRRFQFGTLLFRLLYVLKDLNTAHSLYTDNDLNWLFRNTTCHLVLMDMLYEAGRYWQVVEIFGALQRSGVSAKFTPDCTLLAFAALYQLNSEEAYQEMKRLMEEAKAEGSTLSRRCLLFAAALALRQGEASLALTVAQSQINSSEAVFRNIKMMALADQDQLKEVLVSMERGRGGGRYTVLYSDTIQRLTEQFSARGSPKLQTKFKHMLDTLERGGFLSPQTVEHFVSRTVLRQKKAKASQSFKTILKSPIKIK